MTFPYKLVATDLDGTLLRDDETVSGRTREALAAVTAAGAAHIIVTGRAVPWTRHILDDLGYEGLAVCGQGAQVYHAGEHKLLTSLTLDRQLAGLALSKVEADVGPLALAASRDGLDGEVMVGPGYRVQEGPLPAVFVKDPAELWSAPLNKVYIQHPDLDDDALATAARAAVGNLVDVVMAGPGVVEILPLGLSKATGLSLAARPAGCEGRGHPGLRRHAERHPDVRLGAAGRGDGQRARGPEGRGSGDHRVQRGRRNRRGPGAAATDVLVGTRSTL